MKRVVLRGPVLTQSGYGVHCRQVAKWLLSKPETEVKFQALPWGDTPWILDQKYDNGLIEKIMQNTVDLEIPADQRFDASFQLQLPNEWDTKIAHRNVGLTAGVETDVCNPEWVQACNKMDMVIVPSKHSLDCIKKSGELKVPSAVVPESFCDEILSDPPLIDGLPKFSTDFNFLIFGQITGDNPMNDRKNIFFTIKWLCEVFKDDPNVGIVLKTNIGRNTHIDKRRTQQLVETLLKECRRGQFPRLHLLHGEMSNLDVAALYKHPQIKALVSLTRGEGYGLPILEAATAGLPVIATNWSGHLDFLNRGKFIGLDYKLEEIHPSRVDNGIFLPGFKWANVLEEDFKRKVSKFRSSPEIPREWALDLSKKLKENYNFNSISKMYDELLGDIF